MVHKRTVREQLTSIGSDFRFWGRSEANELPHLLFPDETILHAINGRYEKGFALFCATDQRLLLLDKKPLILCFEDMRYDMISEIDFTEQLLTAELTLRTPGRTLKFTSLRIRRLRELTTHIQEHITQLRSSDHVQSQQQYEHALQAAQQPSTTTFSYSQPVTTATIQTTSFNPSPYHSMSLRNRQRISKFAAPPIEPHKT